MRNPFVLPLWMTAVVVVVLGYYVWNQGGIDSATFGTGNYAQRPLPDVTLPFLENNAIEWDAQKLGQGEVRLFNIFASWCVPCQIENPVLLEAKKQGVKIYGISYKDTKDITQAWLKNNGNPYQTVLLDEEGTGGIEFGMTGVPETYVIDQNDMIVYRHAGPVRAEDWETIFEPLLADLNGSVVTE